MLALLAILAFSVDATQTQEAQILQVLNEPLYNLELDDPDSDAPSFLLTEGRRTVKENAKGIRIHKFEAGFTAGRKANAAALATELAKLPNGLEIVVRQRLAIEAELYQTADTMAEAWDSAYAASYKDILKKGVPGLDSYAFLKPKKAASSKKEAGPTDYMDLIMERVNNHPGVIAFYKDLPGHVASCLTTDRKVLLDAGMPELIADIQTLVIHGTNPPRGDSGKRSHFYEKLTQVSPPELKTKMPAGIPEQADSYVDVGDDVAIHLGIRFGGTAWRYKGKTEVAAKPAKDAAAPAATKAPEADAPPADV